MKIINIKTHLYEFENNRVVGDANSPAGRKLQSKGLTEVFFLQVNLHLQPLYYFQIHINEF